MNLIKTIALGKRYKDTIALKDLNLSLETGETLGLLGPNGAGKTTAIHIMLGLLTPTEGQVSVLGMNPVKQRTVLSSQINFSSAYQSLPSNLKAWEALTIFAKLYGVKCSRAKILELLDMFEVAHLSDHVIGSLSSGERTRLNLAKSMLNDPSLLVLDEPTASLDPDMADKIRKTLKEIQKSRKLGILYTSHNMLEIEEMCHQVVFIHHGKTILRGTPADIRNYVSSKSLEQAFIKLVRGDELVES